MFKLLASSLPVIAISFAATAPAFASDTGLASMLHTLRAEQGRVCQVGHYHVGKTPTPSTNRAKAMKDAKRHWVEFTALEYGSSWGRFQLAANKTSSCDKVNGGRWECKVRARPCRTGLRQASR